MIRLAVRSGLLGQAVDHVEMQATPQLTPRAVRDRFASSTTVPVLIAVDGNLVESEDGLDAAVRDGAQIVVMPQTAGGVDIAAAIVYALITVAVSFAVNYVVSLLSPRPKAPGTSQERGDDASQTYAWDGIKTNYGPGLPIPWVYGYHAVGGQAIWTDVEANRDATSTNVDDRLRLILSLCEGPVHEIGGVAQREANALGGFTPGQVVLPIPEGFTVNGNLISTDQQTAPGARFWTRNGDHDQEAVPAPFAGTSEAFTVNAPLNEAGDEFVFTYAGTNRIDQVSIIFACPAGVYTQGPSGQLTGAFLNVSLFIRRVGVTAWSLLPIGPISTPQSVPVIGYFARTFTFSGQTGYSLPADLAGPVEIRAVRLSSSGGVSVVSQCLLRDITIRAPHTLRYPLEALLALELQAGARFSGSRPQVQIPVKGALVRVWDDTYGWSPRCWNPAPVPFYVTNYPPGRNPSWCLLDFLLSRWGLGAYLTEDKIDLPAFRRWAAWCDTDPNPADPWGEAQFTIDVVGDQPRPAWEWVLAFCAAGRATPIMRNGKISVVYQYRDAHGDTGVTIPAKAPVQLFTSGNVEGLQVNWLSRRSRPTVYQFQFLNELQNWTQDVLPVEDDAGTLNDPAALDKDHYRPESVQAYGVTRPSQLFREGLWRHRITAGITHEISFTTGPWALAAEVGELIDFEHEMLRPFGADVPVNMQVVLGGEAATAVVVDHHLAGTGLQIVVRSPDGSPQRANVTAFDNQLTGGGRPISVLTLAVAVTVDTGATCVVGLVDKLVRTYELVAITLGQDMRREVRAVEWVPEAHRPITRAEFEGALEEDALLRIVDEPGVGEMPPHVAGIRIVAELDGTHRMTWARPPGKVGTWARVYLRPADLTDAWVQVGSTELDEVQVRGLTVGRSYVVSVCLENRRGDTVLPDLGDQLTFAPEEFAPYALPELTNARATKLDQLVLVEADEIQQRDVAYFELAAGSSWAARRVLLRERFPRWYLQAAPAGVPLLLAARSASGLYGRPVRLSNPGWVPPNLVAVAAVDELATTPPGAHSGTSWNAGLAVLELAAGQIAGTYTAAVVDAGYQAPFFWQVAIDRVELENATVGDLAFAIGSGEARWRTVEGRPASPAAPGIDWQTKVDDLAMPIGDLPPTLLAGGHVGEVGSHTQVLAESRFHVDGVWTAYQPHTDRVVLAKQMQVRLTFNRRDAALYSVRVPLLQFSAFL